MSENSRYGVVINPAAPGRLTSEWTAVKIATAVGGVLEAAGLVLNHIQDVLPTNKWVAVIAIVLGALLQICTFYGYQKSRSSIKTAMIERGHVMPQPQASSEVTSISGDPSQAPSL